MLEILQKQLNEQKLSHAYLFEGTHKEVLKEQAMQFAERIMCSDDMCKNKISTMNHPDFYLLETKEQTIKKEEMELMLRRMNQKPVESTHKVYIVVDFDKLTTQGENAILKFLEEPPENTIALLLTTEPSNILPTIHSRCQHIIVQAKDKATQLEELLLLDIDEALARTFVSLSIATNEASILMEDGFIDVRRWAIKWADRLIEEPLTALIQLPEMLSTISDRKKQIIFIDMLQLYFQDILYIKVEQTETTFLEQRQRIEHHASKKSLTSCVKAIEVIMQGKKKLLQYVQPMLVFESIVIQMMKEVN